MRGTLKAMRKPPSRSARSGRCLAALCVAALAVPRALPAQQLVTREQAVAAALAHGPRVALAAPDTEASRAELIGAREFGNPVLGASYSEDTPRYHATVELPLDFLWLRGARVDAAREANASAVLRFRFERASARFDAEEAYAEALASAAQALLSQHTARDADSLRRMAALRRDAGDASDLDVELATIYAGQLVNDAASDSAAAVAALLEVQRVMGLPSDQPQIALADSLALPSGDTAAPAGPTLQVASAEAAARSADAALSLARRGIFSAPSLTFGFDAYDPTPNGERGLLPAFGVALTFPLLNFNGGAIAAASAERARARAELVVARRESDASVARARRDLGVAVARARRDRQLVAAADRVARMSLTAYAEGAVALPSVLEAQRQAREALGRLIDDLAAANVADSAVRLFTATETSP